jgi:transposase
MFFNVTTKYVCGIDLHAKTLTACVMDLNGQIFKKKTIPCQVQSVLAYLAPWGKDITVGVESTYNWYWLIDALKQYEIPCCLGHALYIKRKMSSKHKNDPVDARGIADLLRTNQFPLAYSYPAEMRTVRDLLRRRHLFVRRRAATFTHFQNSLHQDGYIEKISTKLQYKSTRWPLIELTSNKDLQKILSTDLEYIAALDTIVNDLDKTLLEKARYHNRKHLDALQTIAGCGFSTSLTVLYETHTIDRFKTPQCYSSYCRVVGAQNESAGKNLGGTSNNKIGNPHLKWAFSEIGHSMIKNYPAVKEWFDKQVAVYGKPKAHARLRHKIAVTVYYMLKNDTVFDMDKFLGITKNRAENPQQQWTETSGQQSEPIVKADNPPGLSQEIELKESINQNIRDGNPCAQLANARS